MSVLLFKKNKVPTLHTLTATECYFFSNPNWRRSESISVTLVRVLYQKGRALCVCEAVCTSSVALPTFSWICWSVSYHWFTGLCVPAGAAQKASVSLRSSLFRGRRVVTTLCAAHG